MRDKRRLIELGKSILIVLLTLSALFLLTMTPLVQDSGLTDLFRPPLPAGEGGSVSARTGTVLPARMAVYRGGERCGLQYDDVGIEQLFAAFGPLLGDALAGAGEPTALSEIQWRSCLQRDGVYFDFSGEIPLAALARWLGGGGECALEGGARRLVLAAGEGDGVELCWQDAGDGGFYTCPTLLSLSLHLEPALSGAVPNGAHFAFEDKERSKHLEADTLITEGKPMGTQYDASDPLSAAGIETLLDALAFNSRNHAPSSSGEVYLDSADRLVVRDGGIVTYRAAQGGKYPVESRYGAVSAAQAADGAMAIAEAAITPLCGEARLYLMGVEMEGDGWRVRFGYRLNGSAVYLYEEGWAAEFLVQDGYITDFTLRLRCYTDRGGETLLLPIDKAAVMLPDLTAEKRELVIQYWDEGGQTVSPVWEAI